MSLLPEVVDKFQFDTDLFMEALKERVQELFPFLAPEEQQNTPIMQSDTVLATCLVRADSKICSDHPSAPYTQLGVIYKVDVSAKNGIASISDFQNLGRAADDGMSYTEEITQRLMDDIDEWFTTEHFFIHPLQSGHCYFKFQTYNPNMMLSLRYGDPEVESTQQAPIRSIKRDNTYIDSNDNLCYVQLNAVEYSINAQGKVQTTLDSFYMMQTEYTLHGLKGYPVIMNCDNDYYINKYITDNGADNNYTGTYTTPQGKIINLYYGDNYIITNVQDNEPVSYNDVKNALNIAINQINEDNGTDITVPDYPIPPDPGPITDDDYIDMGLGVETDGMAMYNMAVITRDDLIQLITDFEANADTGLSFIPHVLGLYKLGIESSQLLTTKSEQIKLHKEPNGTSAFTSVENYNIVKDQLTVIDCGSITIDREELLTNTFYDYSPYSTYEMFIPGCGWITLPDTVVGRTISVSIVFDLTTCSCKGIVRSEGQLLGGSGTTLATVNGIIGSSVPLSINETGLQRAAIFNGSTQAAMALGTAFLGAGLGNPYMGASGLAMAAGALADNHVAGNTTYTNTKGGATDYSVFGDGYKAVLKITRPVVEIPENYGHTVGFVVNEYGLLGDFHGFTVCVNPHVHISATSDEKEEIKRLLESGVILPDSE